MAGTGVSGTLATITRADDGSLQVTYNGLPLYFFSGDKAAGDATGAYPGWDAVKP
jgi:predicted lipoprotein with Yx(FWY)xxD motif